MSEAITYKIKLDKLSQHLLSVECRIMRPSEDGQVLSLPAWVPGSYMIRDFGKYLVDIQAEANGSAVEITKVDKNTWLCAPCKGTLIIKYHVYGFDQTPRAAYIDHTRVFFDGCRVFLVVEGEEEQTHSVEIVNPQDNFTANWRVVTSMSSQRVDRAGFGTYIANNHLELIDHPFEIGSVQLLEFNVANVPHVIVVTGAVQADLQRLTADVAQICNGHINFFGELPSMDRYIFFLNLIGKGHGGIEHRSSSALLASRSDLPIPGDPSTSEGYLDLLGLFSHEYFHLWNVKRIKPELFLNLDLTAEVYTRQLWIFEGITSYFDNLNLVRNNIISSSEYLNILQKDINLILLNPGSNIQTLEDSSFDAWIKFYKQDENSPNATVSYYVKGALVALALDLLIIKNSRRKQSLADIMQILWQQYGKTGLGIPENYFEHITYEVTGEDYSDFYELALRTTAPLPLQELLLEVGVIYKSKPVNLLDNLGAKFALDQIKPVVRSVINGSAFEQAGLAPNDTIIAVNNMAVSTANLESVIRRYQSGELLKLHIIRNDWLMELEATAPDRLQSMCELELAKNLTEQQSLSWRKWLGAVDISASA